MQFANFGVNIFIILIYFFFSTHQVDGSASRLTIDLRRVQEDEDWSPDCDNVTTSKNSNKYNFTIR